MPSEEVARGVRPVPDGLDFRRRVAPADAPEWMDEPCSYEQFRDTLLGIREVNRVLLGHRPTSAFVDRAAKRLPPGQPLRVLDVGFGGGDTLHNIAVWAERRRLPVRLMGVDMNPFAAVVAAEFDRTRPRETQIGWHTADVFSLGRDVEADVIVSSLMAHHLADHELVRFVRWMEERAQVGWFVNDLLRSARSYKLYRPLTWALRSHPFVKHDGLVSIRRAFCPDDWKTICAEAGLREGEYVLRPWLFGRLCVERLR